VQRGHTPHTFVGHLRRSTKTSNTVAVQMQHRPQHRVTSIGRRDFAAGVADDQSRHDHGRDHLAREAGVPQQKSAAIAAR